MSASDLTDYEPRQFDARDGKGVRIKDAARKVKDTASAVLHDRVEPMVGRARERLDGAVQTVKDTARERPATSALAILGVGILVGAALAITLRRPASAVGGTLRDYGDGLGGSLRDKASDWSGQLRSMLHR